MAMSINYSLPPCTSWPRLLITALLLVLLASWPGETLAMRPDGVARLRQETVDMFYHGYDNYMKSAFPEDELRPISCTPLTRDPSNPSNIGLNDVLGNYSLTLIDSLSSLAVLASAPPDKGNTGARALRDFQDGIAALVEQYGDGKPGRSGQGLRGRGFDVDSKVQVFETVIRGVGGLLSAHLFAVGDLPITGYNPHDNIYGETADPLYGWPISWPSGFKYDGQMLRLALDMAQRLLPAFYTNTGMPYPRVNLRHGIPFYTKSPLHDPDVRETSPPGPPEITETCSAGAGSLVLEFTVLSRLTGDARFEQLAKRAFWAVWDRRSDIGLIGAGVDAEHGKWVGGYAVIGAGADSFFEYALKSHILLSGHELPDTNLTRPRSGSNWLDPNRLHPPLTDDENSPAAFLDAWHNAHAAIKRHLYDDAGHPHYMNVNLWTGSLATQWIDSLGAYYPGLLVLAGELDEAIETNLLYAALWTKYAALPERWSVKEKSVEGGLGWWPLRPEFIESTYHLYRATKDTWYLYVGEMVLRDISRRCRTECGFAGLQNVVTGELSDRMESFFLGETAKYLYLLFDDTHPLNSLDAAYVFTTEGHPLIIPRKQKQRSRTAPSAPATSREIALYYYDEEFRDVCPVPPETFPLTGSAIAARTDIYHAARMLDLHLIPNMHAGIGAGDSADSNKAKTNHTFFPWTLPPNMLPDNATCAKISEPSEYYLEFATVPPTGVFESMVDSIVLQSLQRLDAYKIRVIRLSGMKLTMRIENGVDSQELRVTKVNGMPLGRDESVVIDRALLVDISDPKFKLVRDLTKVKVHHLHTMGLIQNHTATPAVEKVTTTTTTTTPYEDNDDDAEETQKPVEDYPEPELPAITFPANINSFIKSIWTQMVDSALPPVGEVWYEMTSGYPFNLVKNVTGITPIGIGAAPLPPVDIAAGAHIPLSGSVPKDLLPWSAIYGAGDACLSVLDEEGPRDHQVIIIRRGGCTFSDKLANIPAYKPSPLSLQLVIIVSDDESPSSPHDDPPTRPHLIDEQRTPGGIQRRHPIAMVMVGGGEAMYHELADAAYIGITRRYYVESEGRRISNIIIDDGDERP